jgi:hypothetical protein
MVRRVFIFLIAFLLPLSLQARGGHGGHSSHNSYSHRSSSHSYRSSGSHYRTRSRGSSRHSGGVVHTHRSSARHHSYGPRYNRSASGVGRAKPKSSEATTPQQKNLATCLSGTARSACDHTLLTPKESKRVDAAERRENFKTCLSGTSASPCDRSLLTPKQLEQVSQEEKRSSVPDATPSDTHPTGRGYRNSRGEWVPSPGWRKNGQVPSGASAQCADGSYSFSRSRRGTCSHHGGVARWL